MSRKTEFDQEDEQQERRRPVKLRKKLQGKPPKKQSYERSTDVQRWLREQTLPEGERSKPAFDPTFLAGQRDASWILSSLTEFYEQNLITDVLHVVKSGKEATVYCCPADPSTGLAYAAAKVYRPRMFRSLKNDAVYRQSRTQRDIDGRVVRNGRHHQDAFRSERGRLKQVSAWIDYEFQMHCRLSAAGADVPRPLAQMGNAVLMEYIGEVGAPAPLLREVYLAQEEAQPLFTCILRNIELFLAQNCIHGDLSAYNILYWHGVVKIIDFAQAVDPTQSEGTFLLLVRDIERICSYFARYSIVADPYELATAMWERCRGTV